MIKKLFADLLILGILIVPAAAGAAELKPENPLNVDLEKKTISFLARLNAKYLYNPTRHFAVFFKGSNGNKSVFTSLADHQSFYEALTKIGAVAGENMTPKSKEVSHVQGDALDVRVTWKGAKKVYTINEVVRDSNEKAVQIRFGGNLGRAMKKNTGCLICLESCPVGITSNSTYTYGAIEKRKEAALTGNADILPSDGSLVTITVKKHLLTSTLLSIAH